MIIILHCRQLWEGLGPFLTNFKFSLNPKKIELSGCSFLQRGDVYEDNWKTLTTTK